MHGHKGLTRNVPHGVYVVVFRRATNPVIWILLGVYYARLFTFRRRIHPAEWMLALFPILYVLEHALYFRIATDKWETGARSSRTGAAARSV